MYLDLLETEKRLVQMKVSEVTIDTVKNYIHVYHDEDNTLLDAILTASKVFIEGYTGVALADLDLHEDITIALLILCSEMYANRLYSVDHFYINPVVKHILFLHSTNNL
jgi:hypothetical protein